MDTILDLDLDVFSSPTIYWPRKGARRTNQGFTCASPDDVRYFLEQQCRLSTTGRIPGSDFKRHDEAFYTWRGWLDNGVLTQPFRVIHVDAHADMGLGDAGYVYLLSELISLPVEKRGKPARGSKAMNEGNYLAFALANRWVDRLTYVYPTRHPWEANWNSSPSRDFQPDPSSEGAPNDLMIMYFRGGDWRTGILELPHVTGETMRRYIMSGRMLAEHDILRREPPVAFDFTVLPDFQFEGFTHMVVAQSPRFTPPAADRLLPLIREYFDSR